MSRIIPVNWWKTFPSKNAMTVYKTPSIQMDLSVEGFLCFCAFTRVEGILFLHSDLFTKRAWYCIPWEMCRKFWVFFQKCRLRGRCNILLRQWALIPTCTPFKFLLHMQFFFWNIMFFLGGKWYKVPFARWWKHFMNNNAQLRHIKQNTSS